MLTFAEQPRRRLRSRLSKANPTAAARASYRSSPSRGILRSNSDVEPALTKMINRIAGLHIPNG